MHVVCVRIYTHTSREGDGLHTSSKRKPSPGPVFSVAVWFSLLVPMLMERITPGAEAGDRRGQERQMSYGPGPSRSWRGRSRSETWGLRLMGTVTPFLRTCALCFWLLISFKGASSTGTCQAGKRGPAAASVHPEPSFPCAESISPSLSPYSWAQEFSVKTSWSHGPFSDLTHMALGCV